MKKKIYLGTSDFKELLSGNNYFVDKTLMIKEFMESNSKVTLIPRPRRFGKTLNMSMIKYFLEKTECDNGYLFNSLKIQNENEIMELQGKYPVIYVTFKDEKYSNWSDCYSSLKILLSDLFRQHGYLLHSNIIDDQEKAQFRLILNGQGDLAVNCNSLKLLSRLLSVHHDKKVIILIDEYDVPIQQGYLKYYYDNVIEFMRNFLSGALKDNIYVEKAMLTGILRVAKESVFSGLNNLTVSSLLDSKYGKYFGFTTREIQDLLEYFNIGDNKEHVTRWYNGYNFGDNVIYNPWSILSYISNSQELRNYWVNTASNDLIKTILAGSGESVKKELEILIEGGELTKRIDENIIMDSVGNNTENLWSFLLFTGYLKYSKKEIIHGYPVCTLKIPNLEVEKLYSDIIIEWFTDTIRDDKHKVLMESLVNGDIDVFEDIFLDYVEECLSYFDVSGKESENFYHAFVLGLLVVLRETHHIKSNRENGYGRYDVMIIPKDKSKLGIVMEFKKCKRTKGLEVALENALNQIRDKNYKQELNENGVYNIMNIAIAFSGKQFAIKAI